MEIKLDMVHIFRRVFDAATNAFKVKLTGTEIAIELDHADGDSVTSHPAKLISSATGVEASDVNQEVIPALDCSSLRKIDVRVEGEGAVDVLVSPVDSGSYFYKVGTSGETIEICARRVKVVSKGAVGNVHLVGRS